MMTPEGQNLESGYSAEIVPALRGVEAVVLEGDVLDALGLSPDQSNSLRYGAARAIQTFLREISKVAPEIDKLTALGILSEEVNKGKGE